VTSAALCLVDCASADGGDSPHELTAAAVASAASKAVMRIPMDGMNPA
jgi:hypothetical protein